MIFKGNEIEFPAVVKISFHAVIETLEGQVKDKDANVARFAQELLAEVEKYPELRDGFEDPELLKKHKPIVDRLSRILFPDTLLTNEIKGLIPPFNFEPFYTSTRFTNIIKNAGKDYHMELKGYNPDLMYVYGASAILAGYYNYSTGAGSPSSVDIKDEKFGIIRSYRLAYNADMIETVPTKNAPKITEKDYMELMDDFYNVDLWKKKFPPNSYIMKGIGIANLMDITIERNMSNITSSLLNKTPDSFNIIMDSFRNLLGISDLEGGFVEFANGRLTNEHTKKKGMPSQLLGDDIEMSCDDTMCDFSHKQLLVDRVPLVITDIDKFHEISQSELSRRLKKKKNIRSYILAPISNEEEILGFMELASPRKYELNGGTVVHLQHILPIFSMAITRFKREAENLREVIIQQECTTIHPAVKWRFDEEADKFLKSQYQGEQPVFSDIVFNDVYPLYGQLDIKGSSSKRNEAIKADLLKQVRGVRKVLSGALKVKNMPVYEQLLYRLDVFKSEIQSTMTSGSEQRIQNFMNREIKPVLEQIKSEGGEMATLVDKYCLMLNPDLGTVYEERKKFDTSVNILNQTLASMLDEKQVQAQEMFPHYFERYKTDGVEYNMYIGQTISGKQKFDHVFLDNLRLWQLITTCELENKFHLLNKDLETPLEIASLLLVYSSPLSVHFRMDEKRFDVEGAYNARYEIVKKRVDKAHIKGTNERITAPGKIAIIYTSEEDMRDYEGYVEFLESKGLLIKESLEHLELEDLQGITGLKALRVEVNYSDKNVDAEFSVDELLEGIKGN